MQHQRIKVDIAFITPGMFVAQLDRSWLESPFAVHGFEISDEGQIQLLRKFCKFVYVDTARSSIEKERILKAHASKVKDPFDQPLQRAENRGSSGSGRKFFGFMDRLKGGGQSSEQDGERNYQVTTSLKKEIANATAAFDHAMRNMNEILADVKKGSGVDVDKLSNAVGPMVDSVLRNPNAMSWLCYLRDRADGGFCLTITSAVWAVILGRHLGFDRYGLDNLAMGGVLLDIGNSRMPESIILGDRPPEKEEEEILRMHVDYGVEILRTTPGINDDMISMIHCHHERHDGSGYPRGLSGPDIPVYGRIAGLVDCYDAMIAHKPYATAKSSYDAMCELNGLAGTKFQNEMVRHFIQAVGMFPTGSLVELNTGEAAIVAEQHPDRGLRPNLWLVLNEEKKPLSSRKRLALSRVPENGSSRKARWIIKGHEAGAFNIDPKKYFFE